MKRTLKHSISSRLPLLAGAAAVLFTAAITPARAAVVSIDFDDGIVSAGSTLSNQYSFVGATFSGGTGGATGVTNPASTTQPFATTTTMTIANSVGGDTGGSAFTTPISGLVLHSYSSPNGWLGENGDAVFRIDFVNPINFFSIDFGSVSTLGASGIFAVNSSNQVVQSVLDNTTGSSTLSLTLNQSVKSIVITEGTYFDYVAVDNVRFTYGAAVPEPATNVALALGGLGLAGVYLRRRRQAAA